MKHKTQSGFSFIEVTAAMVILSMSLIVLLDTQTRSMNLVGKARSLETATTLARIKMVELTHEATTRGVTSLQEEEAGEFEQDRYPGFRWRYWVTEVPAPDFEAMMGLATGSEDGLEEDKGNEGNAALLAGPLKSIGDIWGKSIRELHVQVLWDEGRQEKDFELVTHLIAPDALAQVQGLIGALSGGGGQTQGNGSGTGGGGQTQGSGSGTGGSSQSQSGGTQK